MFNLSHFVKTRSQGCNAVTTWLKRVVIPLQTVLALMSSANNVISRAYVRTSFFVVVVFFFVFFFCFFFVLFFVFFEKAKTRQSSVL